MGELAELAHIPWLGRKSYPTPTPIRYKSLIISVTCFFSQCEELGSKQDCGSMPVIVQHASLPGGHASIRIQQYAGIITCMGLSTAEGQ